MEEIVIKPWMHSCMYFCTDFFEAYRGKGKIENINARYENNEAIFICRDCLNILASYINSSKKVFFHEIKKMLIQYFVRTNECNRVMIAYLNYI